MAQRREKKGGRVSQVAVLGLAYVPADTGARAMCVELEVEHGHGPPLWKTETGVCVCVCVCVRVALSIAASSQYTIPS